ncbi:MAG TPA: AAA family ATPase, partial [Fimbriimonadaceae bacterium]|nr:AAA family ATPase [Fimbriimonadaceae bacterium]
MRLKRVRLFGFKTFAEKTEFDIQGDLVAVVGSNGCGKSNLVDAILWALGEGNARQLRAQNGQDVIFNGSARKKPVGYAEVTLLFDNEDGSLPLDTSEVSITRRLSRSGESEYFINRQHCRLRDVFDLLADSGLGRAGYAIVGQKEIDQALAASAEDRRAWVDEAAGVQRYRTRKIESLKRLASAKSHLERVSDILSEIETQREPLRAEAELAIKYKAALSSLREVESGLLIQEVAKASREVSALEARVAESMRLAEKEQTHADELEAAAAELNRNARALEADMDRHRGTRQHALTTVERAEAAIRLSEQRLKTLDDLEANLGEEAGIARLRIEEAEAENASLISEKEAEASGLEQLAGECAGAGEAAKALRSSLLTLEKDLHEARKIEAQRMKLEAEDAHRTERRKLVALELQGVDASLPDLDKGIEDAQAALALVES